MSTLTHADTAATARELVRSFEEGDLRLRIMGGVAIWGVLDDATRRPYEEVRPVPADIDLMVPAKSDRATADMFRRLGLAEDERLNLLRGNVRQKWFAQVGVAGETLPVDVFVGDPPLCHKLDFTDGFVSPAPELPATDLLLQKLQIVEINEKDLIDAAYLVRGRDFGPGAELIDLDRIVKLTSEDWGFFHTVTVNLEKVERAARAFVPDPASVLTTLGELRSQIEATPKSRRWKLRARVGTKVQWYTEVEELDR